MHVHVCTFLFFLQITCYIQDIQELKAHTPMEHVDYVALSEMATELEVIHKVREVSIRHSLTHSLTHSFIYLFIHFIHLFSHLFVYFIFRE